LKKYIEYKKVEYGRPSLKMVFLFVILLGLQSFLFGAEIKFTFNNDENIEYDIQKAEVYKGKIRLSPTGFWTNTGSPLFSRPAYLFQNSNKDIFYIGGYACGGLIYKSTNYGNNWITVLSNDDIGNGDFCNIIELTNYVLFSGGTTCGGGNYYKSSNNGDDWISSGLSGVSSGCIFKDTKHNLYGWILFPSQELYKSINNGSTWNNIYSGSIGANWMYELNNGNIILGNMGYIPNGVYISTNEGTNWTIVTETSNYNYGYGAFKGIDNYIYIYGTNGIIRTDNEGTIWEQISDDVCFGLIEASDGIFYKTSETNVWKSFNKGQTWSPLVQLMKDSTVFPKKYRAIKQMDNDKIYLGAYTNDFGYGYIFNNYFALSSEVILNSSPTSINRWFSFSKTEVLNGGNVAYEFSFTTNKGISWSSWYEMTDTNLQSVPCSGEGLDELKVKVTLYSLNHDQTPEIYSISLEYDDGYREDINNVVIAPNPFRPNKNNIHYVTFFNLPEHFELNVYSIAGGKIASLKGSSIVGRYRWDVKNKEGVPLKNGVYICNFKDNKGNEKRLKLVVIR